MRIRSSRLRVTQVFVLTAGICAAAAAPDFSGKWMLDASRSENANGATIELTIQEPEGKIVYQRTLREKDGKQVQTSFTCAPVGTTCDLIENGHKAKVSLWYNGSALMMAKTGGPSHDATTERKFELSPDGENVDS